MGEFLQRELLHMGDNVLTLGHVLSAIVVLLVARLISFLFVQGFHRYARRRKLDKGREYAFVTLFKYFLYTISIFLAIQALGISLNVIWAGTAALFVGLGFGLQQIFRDMVSGLILLIERTVEVNDVVIVDGIIGSVVRIGLRTSEVETRDKEVIIIPNAKLVSENVVNWSHNKMCTRFQVDVIVGFHADVDEVERILLEVAAGHPAVTREPAPRVAFQAFGEHHFIFKLHYFTHEFLANEFVMSDLRFRIVRSFREQGIEIPFPQRDVHLHGSVPTPAHD